MKRAEKVAIIKKQALEDISNVKRKLKEEISYFGKQNDNENYDFATYEYSCLVLLELYVRSEDFLMQQKYNGDYIFLERYIDILLCDPMDISFTARYFSHIDTKYRSQSMFVAIPAPSDRELNHSDFVSIIEAAMYNEKVSNEFEK